MKEIEHQDLPLEKRKYMLVSEKLEIRPRALQQIGGWILAREEIEHNS